MTWNYRIFHRQVPDGAGGVEDEYTIREAYYDPHGQVNAWSEEPASPHGETKLGLMDDASAMLGAISQPVIEITPDSNELVFSDHFDANSWCNSRNIRPGGWTNVDLVRHLAAEHATSVPRNSTTTRLLRIHESFHTKKEG